MIDFAALEKALLDEFRGPIVPRYRGPNERRRNNEACLDDVHAWLVAQGCRNFALKWDWCGRLIIVPVAEGHVDGFEATVGLG